MPANDYACRTHGTMELFFTEHPPRRCPKCRGKLSLVIAPNQFSLGGGMSWLTEPTKRHIGAQLGVVPETASHLRSLEKRLKVRPTEKSEFWKSDSPRWGGDPKPVKLNTDQVHALYEKGKAQARR